MKLFVLIIRIIVNIFGKKWEKQDKQNYFDDSSRMQDISQHSTASSDAVILTYQTM